MNLETRKQEIVSSIKSGSKTTYHRSEILPELLALQQEIVTMTFNQEHADLADLKIWDVERHLVQMNEDCEGVASEELAHFQSGCRQLTNLIKAEISGNWGESKAFSALLQVNRELFFTDFCLMWLTEHSCVVFAVIAELVCITGIQCFTFSKAHPDHLGCIFKGSSTAHPDSFFRDVSGDDQTTLLLNR